MKRVLWILFALVTMFGCAPKAAVQGANLPPPVENPFKGQRLFVPPDSYAARWAASHQGSKEAKLMAKVAMGAKTMWVVTDTKPADLIAWLDRNDAAGCLAVLSFYNIPLRDAGEYSAGGANDPDEFRAWIKQWADIFRGRKKKPVIILEPDSLSQLDRLPKDKQEDRYGLLKEAVITLREAGASVYLDAGHSNWHPAYVMADRLKRAGIEMTSGFSLNISNFQRTDSLVAYGKELSKLVGGKGFVLDTSRNGKGPSNKDGDWFNPHGRGLGEKPTTATGDPLIHAKLWIKDPTESDAKKDGAPKPGDPFDAYALELAKNASW